MSTMIEVGDDKMKIFKRFLDNLITVLKFISVICGGILGLGLLYMSAGFINDTFSPLVGVLVLVLLIALALSILITVLDILSEDMEDEELD